MPLIFIAGIVLLAGLILFFMSLVMFADIVVLCALLYYKLYGIALIAVPLTILIRTIWYYKTDIFACVCEQELAKATQEIEDEESINQLLIHEGPRYVNQKIETSREGSYALFWAPHTCENQSTTIYSPSKRYKVTLQHTIWHNYFVYQQHEFTLIWEHADHE